MRYSICFLLNIFVVCSLVSFCSAPPTDERSQENHEALDENGGSGHGHGYQYRSNYRRLADSDMQTLQSNCDRREGGCHGRSDRAQRRRKAVKESMKRSRRSGGGYTPGMSDYECEIRLQKTLEVKRALLKVNGITAEPHDDGLIGGDMQLNTLQLERLLNRTKGIDTPTDAEGNVPLLPVDSLHFDNPFRRGYGGRRKRADIVALDYYTGNKWPSTTVNYYINPNNFTQGEGDVIRAAVNSIASVSCLVFTEGWANPVIEYVKAPDGTDPGTCGWSQVGYQGSYNSININFASTICSPTLQGVVVHETLHALGFVHEHNRYDRDKYLKIDWSNVDPQSYDIFDKDDPHDHNPFCVTYDPLSIMHYDAYVGAVDGSKPVMTTITSPELYLTKMGQGTAMAPSDIKALNKIYCTSSTCVDLSTNCGWTACTDCNTYGHACPRSCGQC